MLMFADLALWLRRSVRLHGGPNGFNPKCGSAGQASCRASELAVFPLVFVFPIQIPELLRPYLVPLFLRELFPHVFLLRVS